MDLGVVNTLLQSIARTINSVKSNVTDYYTTNSLADFAKLTRVEPLTIVSKDCVNLEYMPDVMHSLLALFSGYYLQAVNMLMNVDTVEVVRTLDKLNPDRDQTGFLLEDSVSREQAAMSLEAYKHSLPTGRLSLEAPVFGKDQVSQIHDLTNLSVGKLLNVTVCAQSKDEYGTVKNEGKNVDIAVSVRLLASIIPNLTITKLLTVHTDETSITERYHAWRSGRISFIRDLILCQDLITEYKKSMVQDESGTMLEILRRVNNSKKYGLLSKNPSLVSASNIFVISEEVAREIESKLGGKLSNKNIRDKAFENTYAMIIAVVDREWERVTFYVRGINASSDLSIKEIKANAKSKGPDITDIMKSMQIGSSPF